MGIPLEEIGSGRQRDHAARSLGRSEMEVTQLFDSLCPRLDELEQKLATPPEERPQEAGDSQDDVTVVDGSEQLGAEPFGPEERDTSTSTYYRADKWRVHESLDP